MFTKADAIAPLTNTKANVNGKSTIFSAATFHYTEESSMRSITNQNHTQQQGAMTSASRSRAASVGMNGLPSNAAPPIALYVRALYDYTADERTSLSFRKGDTIQVINQLRSGWWDGIINDVRGWFPSNYCEVVTGPDEPTTRDEQRSPGSGTDDGDIELTNGPGGPRTSVDSAENKEQEEAAFWIPQATPDGRLFYFNTLTGVSTMELPLETPTSANESGPRDRMNIYVPSQTRPPPELMARGLERDEDEYDGESASELEESPMLSQSRRRRSYISDGISPAVSTESFDSSPAMNSRGYENPNLSIGASQQASTVMPMNSTTTTSFTTNPLGQVSAAAIPRSFFDDGSTAPLTWNKLVDNIRKSIESYRQAISNADRSEYVRKAEDISDHLRMLLAAASGTTDNHSGNPSIISTNKALYPHFRDMMSRFSKLVLSSHIASADWPAQDAYTKCLQEAEGVLQGVYSYVEVARSQRGEEIPRLVPGFVLGSNNGGNWQNNSLGYKDPMLATSFMDQDEYEPYEPVVTLDSTLLERMDELKRMIVSNIRRLEEHLTIREKLITPFRHKQIGNAVCQAAGKVIEFFRPWISSVESIDLSPLGTAFQNPQLTDFTNQKQRMYDLLMHLLLACQAVAAPLGDEWAESRGDPLEDRLNEVRTVVRKLEACTSQVGLSLQLLLDMMPQESDPLQELKDAQQSRGHRTTDGGASYESTTLPNLTKHQRPQLADMNFPMSYTEGVGASVGVDPAQENYRQQNHPKIKKFFGEVPRDIEEEPSFLKLDYEGEISYDAKTSPPQLRGGTLIALVEQLTRHDRLDSHFNSTFLLTYRSFTTASELFGMLVKRFSTQPPRGISAEDYKTWEEKKQKPIRFRIVNILKAWLDTYWMENADEASDELLRRIYSFAKDHIATTSTPMAPALMTAVERRTKGQDSNAKGLVPTQSATIPTPIMPKNMKKLKFLDIDAIEFARQLTIIESRLYGRIKPTECLNKTWQKKLGPADPDPAANVKALILHSNQLTNWVAEMILNQSDVKKRVVVIKHFVSVADVSSLHQKYTIYLLTQSAMSFDEQFLDTYLYYICTWHSPYTSACSDLGTGQCSHTIRATSDADVDEK